MEVKLVCVVVQNVQILKMSEFSSLKCAIFIK